MNNGTTAEWTDQCPAKADAGDAYYFVRRKDKLDVVVMGFSMGKGWLNGVSYEAPEMRNHLFLGPITPELFAERDRLREALEMTICHGCSNRIGFTGEEFVRDGNEWRKCPNCRKARAALSGKVGEGNGE